MVQQALGVGERKIPAGLGTAEIHGILGEENRVARHPRRPGGQAPVGVSPDRAQGLLQGDNRPGAPVQQAVHLRGAVVEVDKKLVAAQGVGEIHGAVGVVRADGVFAAGARGQVPGGIGQQPEPAVGGVHGQAVQLAPIGQHRVTPTGGLAENRLAGGESAVQGDAVKGGGHRGDRVVVEALLQAGEAALLKSVEVGAEVVEIALREGVVAQHRAGDRYPQGRADVDQDPAAAAGVESPIPRQHSGEVGPIGHGLLHARPFSQG